MSKVLELGKLAKNIPTFHPFGGYTWVYTTYMDCLGKGPGACYGELGVAVPRNPTPGVTETTNEVSKGSTYKADSSDGTRHSNNGLGTQFG